MKEIFYIFGSASSIDYDVLVLIPVVPNNKECHALCKTFEDELKIKLIDKKINVNLASISNGIITDVFKGTADEVNNSVLATHIYHIQSHPMLITQKVKRDLHVKLMRATRIILSFLSRTSYRDKVKLGLKGNFIDKLEVLADIDIATLIDLGSKATSLVDFKKACAFQLGQSLALMNGVEIYSKEELAEKYPDLGKFLYRDPSADMTYLNKLKDLFIYRVRIDELKKMTKLVEDLRH